MLRVFKGLGVGECHLRLARVHARLQKQREQSRGWMGLGEDGLREEATGQFPLFPSPARLHGDDHRKDIRPEAFRHVLKGV